MNYGEILQRVSELNSALILVFGFGLSQLTSWVGRTVKKYKNQPFENRIREVSQEVTEMKTNVASMEEKTDANETSLELLKACNLALLHDKIYYYCTKYIERGYILVDELDNLDYLFQSYKGIGGNGTGETLYNRVKNLDLKSK